MASNKVFSGKTALITGSSKGIGRAVASRLADGGCNLILAARSREFLDAVRRAISEVCDVAVVPFAGDLAQPEERTRLVETHPDIDILVNNAGAIPGGTLDAIDEVRWREGWELKVFGYVDLCRRYYDRMTVRRSGAIVNIIGAAGQVPDANYICGSTGNAALMTFTRALGGVSMDKGVRVVGVNPGLVSTQRMETLLRAKAEESLGAADRWRELAAHLPGGRPAKPEEIANAVAFLASPEASYISGTILTVDGGFSARGKSF